MFSSGQCVFKDHLCCCREASSFLDPTESMETVEEQRAHSPPASLVPRLHMLYAEPLQHNNPLLPSAVSEDKGACKTAYQISLALHFPVVTQDF